MLTITLNNPEIEEKIFEFVKTKKKKIDEVIADILKEFLENKKEDKLVYEKKDPYKHIKKISYEYDEDLSDVIPYSHIKDSAEYVHNLRRVKK